MHLLVIPSWYPKTKDDLAGNFFREQALALFKDIEKVGVLSLNFLSIKHVFGYDFSNNLYEVDDGVITYRKNIINWFPRMRFLQKFFFENNGLKFFEEYIRKNGKPDLIHAHSIFYGGFLAEKIKEKYDIPFVLTEHSSIFLRGMLGNHMIKEAHNVVQSANFCFAVSNYFSKELNKIFKNEWHVINNIVNSKFLEDVEIKKGNNKNSEFYFLSICHLNKNKRLDLIIEAFAKKFKNIPHVKYRIGGDGEEKDYLVNLTKKLGIENKVEFLGSLSREMVIKYMKESHVFLLGSNFETFSVVIVEALALGLPVVSTQCGGPNDILNEKVGLLSPVGDINLFSENMQKIFFEYKKYNSIEIRNYCESKYSSRIINTILLKYYIKAISCTR